MLDGLVEPEAGFDRNHHKVKSVGQREAKRFLAFRDSLLEEEARQHPSRADTGSHQTEFHDGVWRHLRIHQDANQQHRQRGHDANTVKNTQRVFGAEAGARQIGLEVSDFNFRGRYTRADLMQDRYQYAALGLVRRVRGNLLAFRDHRLAQLPQELARLVNKTVSHPAEDDHQHEERTDGKQNWM